MSYEVRFLTKEEIKEHYGYYSRWDEFSSELGIWKDGVLVQTERDGGEPEDNTFGRDWNWVPLALMDAYNKGIEDGKALNTKTN